MVELKKGKWSSRSLAEWFGVSYNTYKNDISKYLEQLEFYCDFEKIYGGVTITEIYVSTYDKSLNMADKALYTEEIQRWVEEQEGLSTFSGMTRKFKKEGKLLPRDNKTYAKRFSKVATTLFGEMNGISSIGDWGTREYIWAVKISDYNEYRFMTPEEEKRFDDIITTCYGSNADQIKNQQLLEEALQCGEIETTQYFALKERLGLNIFKDCIFQFREETGLQIVRCQKHEIVESAF